jgi:hypothetical protein
MACLCYVGTALRAPVPHTGARSSRQLGKYRIKDLVSYMERLESGICFLRDRDQAICLYNGCNRELEGSTKNYLSPIFLLPPLISPLGRRAKSPPPLPAEATSYGAEVLPSWALTPLTTWYHDPGVPHPLHHQLACPLLHPPCHLHRWLTCRPLTSRPWSPS